MARLRDVVLSRLSGGRWAAPAAPAEIAARAGISADIPGVQDGALRRSVARSEPPDDELLRLQAALGKEMGTSGLNIFGGYVREAYTPELYWPDAYRIYNDMRRRTTTVRALLNAITMLAHQAKWKFEGASSAAGDQAAADFGNSCLEDMEGSMDQFVQDALTALPFGWSWHEVNFNRRDPAWRPPDPEDEYRSRFDDGRVGWRSLAYRRQSAFLRWDANNLTRRVRGLWFIAPPNPQVLLPITKAVHFTPFRDGDNPEGQALLESSYTAWYYAKNYEVILGVGTERSIVGWPVVSFDEKPEADDLAAVKKMIAVLLAGSEKGYLTEPPGIHLRFENVKNENGVVLLDIIKFYHVSMLQTVLADFIWLGAGERGSWALGQDKSALFIMAVNGVLDALAETLNARAVKQLYQYNNFPGMTELPVLTHSGVHKPLPLDVLGTFVQTISQLIPLSDDDQINIRLATDGLLAKTTTGAKPVQPQLQPAAGQNPADGQQPAGAATTDNAKNPDEVNTVGALAQPHGKQAMQWLLALQALPPADKAETLAAIAGHNGTSEKRRSVNDGSNGHNPA